MKYSLHPAALEDLQEAAEFYRSNAGVTLSQSFFVEIENAIELLLAHPSLGARWRYGKRRFVMKHFPFGIIYKPVGDELRILAVAHHNRRPGYWRGRR